jgi:hypothetical protein
MSKVLDNITIDDHNQEDRVFFFTEEGELIVSFFTQLEPNEVMTFDGTVIVIKDKEAK